MLHESAQGDKGKMYFVFSVKINLTFSREVLKEVLNSHLKLAGIVKFLFGILQPRVTFPAQYMCKN